MRAKRAIKKEKNNILKNIITVIILGAIIVWILSIAPNYKKTGLEDKLNLVINSSNVTKSLKNDIWIDENNTIYISQDDVKNFFDNNIYYDEQYNQIITTSDKKVAVIGIGKTDIQVNSGNDKIYAPIIEKDGKYYLPFSELDDVYNTKTSYIKEGNTIVIESLDRELNGANARKNVNVKALDTIFSYTVDKINKGDNVYILEKQDKWTKVRTAKGKIGYIKTSNLVNEYNIREAITEEKQIQGKVSLVWDYYSEYVSAPNREGTSIEGVNVVSPSFYTIEKLGKGEMETNVGDEGKAYIEWAHNNGYKVWPIVSNNSMIDTTSEIMKDYKLREKLINNIVDNAVADGVDGINIDFENMYAEDKDLFTRFLIELAPRLREVGMVLSVDVTAPDGSDTWSKCFDRYNIGQVVDYIIFMAYDQYGASSPKEGTTAGADWVEANVKKFLGQEGVEAEKLVLGMPFYTRLWKEENGEITSNVLAMNEVNEYIPESANKEWNEELKQYYVEYIQDGVTYKIWIEDEESIKAKFDIMNRYQLAGAAYWEKDRETDTLWSIIKQELEK